ncbi:MAG: hypothetical protein AAF541_13000 [Pseudomonadota bacterium]
MTGWADSQPTRSQALTREQIDNWRERGYALVHNLLPQSLLHQAQADALEHFPNPASKDAARFSTFGSAQKFVFPSQFSSACNNITLHPDLLSAVATLLDVPIREIRLTQSDLWPKYGRPPGAHDQDNADQRMHCDYPNHTLTHPPEWDDPDAVEIIIYLSEFEECLGSTAVVPRMGKDDPAYPWPIMQTPGVAGLNYVNDKAHAEAYLHEQAPDVARFREQNLYAREVLARYQFGSVLFYRHDTWHRGTPVKEGALRLVHNMTFKKARAEWVNVLHPGWAWSMYRQDQFMEKLIAAASVDQRCVLGFPAPGSPYWNEATLEAVQSRYGAHGIDMTPYCP